MGQTRTRSVAIDLVRVIAIVGVVARHNWYDPKGAVALVVCPWAIAVFFVLTGYLWSSKRTVQAEIKNRYKGLLIPYITWMILISVPYFIWAFQHYPFSWALQLFVGAGYGGKFAVVPYSACWFFTTMFFAAVFMRYLERFPRRVTWAVIAVTIAITCTVPVVLKYGPLGSTLALPCMLFIVMGQELRRYRARITQPLVAGLAFLAAGTIAVVLGASHNTAGVLIEVKNSTYGYPVAGLVSGAIISIGLILIAESTDRYIPSTLGPSITKTASTATFIMFLHPCILLVLGVTTAPFGNWPTFLLAFVVPYALALACLRAQVFPWLTGVWPPKAAAENIVSQNQPLPDRRPR